MSHDHAEFLRYWEKVRARTRRLVPLIPAERLEWAPGPAGPTGERRFTCGDLVRHLSAIERWMFAENVCGRPSRYPGHGTELARGLDAVLALHDRLHGEAMEIFRGLDEAQLAARCPTPGGVTIPAWKWLRSMVEHEAHHRGQLYLHLSLLGIATPPLYGLTSEEVRARSVVIDA